MSDDLHTPWQAGVTDWAAAVMNVPLKELDIAIQSLAKLTAIDKDLTAPPGGESDGDTYIVGSGGAGGWSGHDDDVAYYDDDNSEWKFLTPDEGVRVYVQDENTEYYYTGAAWARYNPYIIAAFYPGTPGNSEICMRHTFPIAVDFPAGLTDSQSESGTAANAQTIFIIKKNGSPISGATITYAVSGSVGTLAMTAATSFAIGDTIEIFGPASADAAIADIDFALKGAR